MIARVVNCHSVAEWNFSLWFTLLSPLIGILLGLLGGFLLYH
jgi:ABC-type microcin C transport system permease subunit YejE